MTARECNKCGKEMKDNVWDNEVHVCTDCNVCVYDFPNKYAFIDAIEGKKSYMFIDKEDLKEYKSITGKEVGQKEMGFVTLFASTYPTISGKDIARRGYDVYGTEQSGWKSYCEVDLIEVDYYDIPEDCRS